MAMPRASELYPVHPWMEKYFLMFNNTGGNDVVELLHDDDTSAFANVVRYLLICSVRSQYTLLLKLHEAEALHEISGGAPCGSGDMLQRWVMFGKAMQKAGCDLPHNLIAETEELLKE